MASLEKLLSIAGVPLSERAPEISHELNVIAGPLADQLINMLSLCNGFYAFESALHVFPSHSTRHEIGIADWNERNLWCDFYKGLADGCLFFAEDIFGGQFCIKDGKINIFEPETGSLEYLADDIESWAQALLIDYEVLTGHSLAHQWQLQNGQIPVGKRLLPKTPFVVGGEFNLNNLHLADPVEGMRFRADIACQIKDLPDGARLQLALDR